MARRNGTMTGLLAVWISFVNTIILLLLGFAVVSGQLSFAGTFLNFLPNGLLLFVGWTAVILGSIGLITLIVSFAQGLLRRL